MPRPDSIDFEKWAHVAAFMGDEWNLERLENDSGQPWRLYLKGPTFSFFVRMHGNLAPKCDISASMPDGKGFHSLGAVSQERSPQSIAKDIMRRMLPSAKAWVQQEQEKRDRDQAFANGIASNIERIRKALGKHGHTPYGESVAGYWTLAKGEISGANFQCSADSVTVKLRRVPVEVAEQIIAFMSKLDIGA